MKGQNVKLLRSSPSLSVFLQRELVGTIMEISRRGADGMILWGSSADLDTEAKCNDFRDYLHEVLGPTLLRVQRQINNLV
uniref:Hyaluronidase n=1 Tax=Trichogramma kaykai TaxID=54128 RepID=A0ABD2VTE1_9HYME